MPTGPRVSIVTPSFNQGAYLDETLRSVLDNGYGNVEYVVVDGASTDNSVDVIRRHEGRLAWWVTEKDKGHLDALNKGFARCTGDVCGWINSDDKLFPGSLSVVAEIFDRLPQVQWITTMFPLHWDQHGRAIRARYIPGYSRTGFFRGENMPGSGWAPATGYVQQESTFWRRSLWDTVGGLHVRHKLAGDFDLWARFYEHADLYGVGAPLGGFRTHGDQKTGAKLDVYIADCVRILEDLGHRRPSAAHRFARGRILKYIPDRLKRPLGLSAPRLAIMHMGPSRGWEIVHL